MVNTALYVLFIAGVCSAIQVDYVAPATSYIYRNDHTGPASLIQVGGHGYKQPDAFAAPLPLTQPKYTALEAYDLEPAPLPYVAAKSIAVEDAEDGDDSDESSEEYIDGGDAGFDHGSSFEKGAGSAYGEGHHSAQGEKGSKGYNSKGYHAKGESGHYGKKHDEGEYEEAEGEKKGHHDEAAAHGKHYASGEGYKGGDHGHKKHFSKGEDVSGYHKVFHKDEYKKDHDFYDVADKSGHFKKHGYENAHHGAEKGGHEKGGHHDSAFNKGGFGKAGYHAKGHIDDADHGHDAKEGYDSHYDHGEEYGKKGGSSHKKAYVYGDDDDDEK